MSERVYKRSRPSAVADRGLRLGARTLPEECACAKSKLSNYERAHAPEPHRLHLVRSRTTWPYALDRPYEEALALEELPESMQVTLLNLPGPGQPVRKEDYAQGGALPAPAPRAAGAGHRATKVLLAAALLGQERYADALEPPLLTAGYRERRRRRQRPARELAVDAGLDLLRDRMTSSRDARRRRELVLLYPREQYVMNLAALHGQLGDQGRQLALIESLLDDERLTQPTHLRMIVNLYLGEETAAQGGGAPGAGARQPGVSSATSATSNCCPRPGCSAPRPRTRSNRWPRPRQLSESGELYLRLARLHMDAYRLEEADEAARAALKKGGLRREGQAWLLRGMAEVRLKRFTDARRRFEKAAGFKETEKYAGQWLTYLESEAQRAEALSNS
jgi:tetratricopeptide (TPR) repeat protein